MRILVCDGRDYNDKKQSGQGVRISSNDTQGMFIHGGAPSAGAMAGWIGGTLGIEVEYRTAQWAKYGRTAGTVRNQEMLDNGIDSVVAFPEGSSIPQIC